MSSDFTADQSWTRAQGDAPAARPRPGVVVVFSAERAAFRVQPIGGAPLTIGRDASCELPLEDQRASRRHAEVSLDGGRWLVRDLGSRNGTFLEGDVAKTEWPVDRVGVLGIGDSICLLAPDVQPLLGGGIERVDDTVIGPRLDAAWRAIEAAAQTGTSIHFTGETGTGKDVAARHFHETSPRKQGPYIAVNCAAIPAALAERLLFGAKRGAYSGADTDTEGYLTSAHKGTLFLDELGELPLEVQAKLLRAVDTFEVLPLGASQPRAVDVVLLSASHGELRARVAAKRFRDDLYFRLCKNEIALPPLRARLEELPWLVQAALTRHQRTAHVSLIETVLRRSWPGNIRELLGALDVASANAARSGDKLVRQEHLPPHAGRAMRETNDERGAVSQGERTQLPSDEVVLHALRTEQGNVVRAARVLGLSRGQVRRWLTRKNIDPKTFTG